MAVSVESFKNTFEQFRDTAAATVRAQLAIAELRVASSVWGDKTDAGILYLTAHMVSLNPAGMNAKLKPIDQGDTIYLQEFRRLRREVTFGLRTAGVPPASAFNLPD